MSERFVAKPQKIDEELLIDESIPPLERVKLYSKSDRAVQKIYLVRDLLPHAQAIGYEDSFTHIIPALDTLSYDNDINIRVAVGESLGPFTIFMLKETQNETNVYDSIFPILFLILKDRLNQVREPAVTSLLSIAQHMGKDKVKEHLLPLINELMEDTFEEDSRGLAIHLLNKMAPVMGPELTREHTLPLLSNFASDPIFKVRVSFVSTMNSLFDTIGVEDTTKILLPLYLDLSKDEIWTVRKTCASMIAEISQHITSERREQELTPLFDYFSIDSSRWVRIAALSAFGQFIVTFPHPFPHDDIHNKLISYFCNLAATEEADAENQVFCAFNFPAVLITVGKSLWPILQPTYMYLSKNNQWKVRRSLAYSLHEIAKILGQEITEECLVSVFESFLKDIDDVKVGVIKNLSKFLETVSPDIRKRYTHILEDIQQPPFPWRFRKLIGKQIGDLVQAFDGQTCNDTIIPIVHSLMQDPVARVRSATLSQIGKVIANVGTLLETDKKAQFLKTLQRLATHKSYQQRLMFAKICFYASNTIDKETFSEHFLNELLNYSKDSVPNVRVATAEALFKISKEAPFCGDQRISDALELLATDVDPDVKIALGGIVPEKLHTKQ